MFIHGLRFAGGKVWLSSGKPVEVWPLWLADDIESLGIWSVEHDSAPTLWHGYSMARSDRAANVLALLLSEPRLRSGDISFVVHSFGGLILEQMLRIANERSALDPDTANFLKRISRVTFLGTPHRGATLATLAGWLRLLTRPSHATKGLELNDPDLRDLNQFYRTFASQNGIETLSLVETRPIRVLRIFGLVVKPDSSDVGVLPPPIPVDADHFGVAAPSSKNSEIYVHIREHLSKPIRSANLLFSDPTLTEVVARGTQNNSEALARIEQHLAATANKTEWAGANLLADTETRNRLMRVRRKRFFEGSNYLEEAKRLAHALRHGPLCDASPIVKADALAWCARLLLAKSERQEALEILQEAAKLERTESVEIVEALAEFHEGRALEAIRRLSKLQSPEARTAHFIVVSNDGVKDPLDWLNAANLSPSSLDSDGKFFVITKQLELSKWSQALSNVNSLTNADFDQSPILLHCAATTHLLQAVPDELKSTAVLRFPYDLSPIPLADDALSLAERRLARDLYRRVANVASELECTAASNEGSDRALWLALRDPMEKSEARADLERSMRDVTHSLRRMPMAVQVGIKLDQQAIERELERRDALSNGTDPDLALAHLTIAVTKSDANDAANYFARHRETLLKHLNPAYVKSIEVELLARSGQIMLAEQNTKKLLEGGLNDEDYQRLLRIISEAKGEDPTQAREEQFKQTRSLGDLTTLVNHLESQEDWRRLCQYGQEYLNRTRDLRACQILARAMFKTANYSGVLSLLDSHRQLVDQSDELKTTFAWSSYWTGNLEQARQFLVELRSKRDFVGDRTLLVSISIASGDWASLGTHVEAEWERRAARDAKELFAVAQLAHQLGTSRAKELILEAASRGSDDPAVLVGCYTLAVNMAWESEQTSAWLERAAELSGSDGPVKRLSLRELLDLQPDWQQRETKTWDQLSKGEIPVFIAGRLLNKSLCDLYLLPAIANVDKRDPRKRTPIYAYSGARSFSNADGKKAAFDPTALLTLGILRVIDRVFRLFERVVVPHSTLAWLFEERARVNFHQPQAFIQATEIRRLLSEQVLQRLEPSVLPDENLASEVGDDLASLFAEAEADYGNDRRQRLVVRSSPVHRVGSLMEEEADLGQHSSHVCSCLGLVGALAREGQLTQAEEQRARVYLKLREKEWPSPIAIEPGGVLYLDGLSLSYFQHLGLLAKIHRAGFTVILSGHKLLEIDRLSQYEGLTSKAMETIEVIRQALADGIASNRVTLAPSSPEDHRQVEAIVRHPTFEMFQSASLADILVVDDRHFNRHGHITGAFGTRPVWTTYDIFVLLANKSFDVVEMATAMRRCGYRFVPIRSGEITSLIGAASVRDGQVIESAELKAVRESLLLVRMSDSLQVPDELTWHANYSKAFVEAIKMQWDDTVEESAAYAKSSWLFEQIDVRQWAHRLTTVARPDLISEQRRLQVILLAMQAVGLDVDAMERYWNWLESFVLGPIRKGQPELYYDIVKQVRVIIVQAIQQGVTPHDEI